MNLPQTIDKIHIFMAGDHSVGIQDFEAEITSKPLIDLDVFAEEDRASHLKEVREAARNLFEVITGEGCEITFDFEREERRRKECAEEVKAGKFNLTH